MTGWGKWSTGNCARNLNTNAQYIPNLTSRGFWDTISARRSNLMIVNKKKKENLPNSGLFCPGRPRVKLKEGEKRNKYLNFARKLMKLWNMKITVIRFVNCALGTIPKTLVTGLGDLEIREQEETIKTADRKKYWDKSWRIEETCFRLNSSEIPSTKVSVKNSQRKKNDDDDNITTTKCWDCQQKIEPPEECTLPSRQTKDLKKA